MKKIILTGGGTAGHVTPNIALLPHLKEKNLEVIYIGSQNGIEKTLIKKQGISYYGISSGKLRRYFSLENFTDSFRVVKGINDARKIIKKVKPDLVFSKGGFVSVPVVLAAKFYGVPVIIHESDITPGLANKISLPFSDKVCTTFPETLKYLPKKKGVNTGTPIRGMLFCGDRNKGFHICGFNNKKPVIMMMGGSLGSVKINTVLRQCLGGLLADFQIVHLCGKGNVDGKLLREKGYKQFEFLGDELAHVYAMTDIVISRAGSNSISEFLALNIPNLLIPLSTNASRGDQILNARSFEDRGFSKVLLEEDLDPERLSRVIYELFCDRDKYMSKMKQSSASDGVGKVMEIIGEYI